MQNYIYNLLLSPPLQALLSSIRTKAFGPPPAYSISMPTDSIRMRVAQLLFCLLCCHASAATPTRCSAHDRAALLAVAAHLGHQEFIPSLTQSWTGSECCAWEGVNCSAQNRVNSLVLTGIYPFLTGGTITPAICELEMLHTLHLSSVALQGDIPSCLCNLQTLQSLHLSWNIFEGGVPSCLCNLQKLQNLDLSGNFHGGGVPSCLCNLQMLQSLNLGWNNLGGDLPSCLCNLQMLQGLDLSGNSLRSGVPSCLCSLQILQSLDLSDNSLGGGVPSCLNDLQELTYLDLSKNSLEGNIPVSLFRLPKLKKLYLGSNQLNLSSADDLLSDLCKLSHLEEVDLRSSGIRGTLPRCFSQLRNLSVLMLDGMLDGNELTGSIPIEWRNLARLSALSLSDNRLQIEELPSWLWTLPFLQTLALRSCNISSVPACGLRMDASNCSLQSAVHFQLVDLSSNPIKGRFPLDFLGVNNFSFIPYLNLSRTQLSGSISSAISSLNVVYLDLSLNYFSGTIPSELWNTTNYVDLSQNLLTGGLPSRFPAIDYLDLSLNQLSGTIPSELWNTTYLYLLDLSQNLLTGGLRDGPGMFSCKFVFLGYNFLEGVIPKSFGQEVVTLSLPGNNFNGPVPRFIGSNYTKLELLDLSGNSLEGTLENLRFSDLASLRVLLLASNRMSGNIADSFHNVTGPLQVIDLSGNQITGCIPRNLQLPGIPDVSDLDAEISFDYGDFQSSNFHPVQVTIVAKGLIMHYTHLYKLVELNLQDNNLTGTIPDSLSNLSNIIYLNLSNNRLTGHIPASLSKLVNLESLDLSRNSLTGHIPDEFAAALTNLEVFNVSYNHLVGAIPYQNQFSTFNASSYEGNDDLCSSTNDGILNRCNASVQPPPLQTPRQPSTSNFQNLTGNWPPILVGYVVSLIVHLWVLNRLLKRFFPMLYE